MQYNKYRHLGIDGTRKPQFSHLKIPTNNKFEQSKNLFGFTTNSNKTILPHIPLSATANTSTSMNGSSSANTTGEDVAAITIVIGGIKFVLAIFTLFTAASLVYVTIRSRNLHGPCNLLLAANSLCIALYSLTFFNQFAAILIVGPRGISVRLCCILQSLPIIGNYGQYVFFTLIALDRLIGVLLPIWARDLHLYIRAHQKAYILALFSLGFGYGLGACISSIVQAFTYADRLVICETGTSTPQFLSNIGMALAISSAIFYLALLISFKLKQWKLTSEGTTSSPDNEYTRRLLRSLMAIFLMECFGWSSNQIATKVLNALGYESTKRWFIKSYVGYLTQGTLMMYAPILFIMSMEYRRGFSKTFGLKKINNASKRVAPMNRSNYTATTFPQMNQQKVGNMTETKI